ncbi:creatinine amidohydrolase [Streptoalloteichus tenebrarius]|uniref:Creatinine amidohydrolase n=1 Tax=Streptoalloteichus tenebrarius (strain ATCC 17920 / DSM 40477 / JCM 4838 / CBS 697.72 / NBRC 16177 / NCIMB 11028 / NRRL B-12390 / A12253. 1 / ISP 5477) TaxID=1933 RepID=A0ABT1HYT7_STRSD|nr:creatininase family protein [Streptoalloteichus tenebrarius]MCP2260691.1 creatinine amidohydrolase [Streptoalloteichus tenebrarius]BFF03776.1 creatininase family protein [Streptoalloteichus tenebrarius]
MFFADLTSPQVAELLAGDRAPVLLLPVGVTEPHGPHAPLSTDSLISQGMCARAARRLADDDEVRVLVLPPVPYGVTRYGAAFPGAVSVSEETLHALVVEICFSLLDQGFRHIVVVNNHFEAEHVATLHRAVDTVLRERDALVGYLDLTRRRRAARLTEEFRTGSCHAGRYETSLVLADRPDLVDQERMRALPEVVVDLPRAMAEGRRDFHAMGMAEAYCGAPALASAEEGEDTFEVLTDMLVEVIRDLVRGTGGRDVPRPARGRD